MTPAAWSADVLGAGFEQTAIDAPRPSDAGDRTWATLVRSLPPAPPRLAGSLRAVDVLYVHGWSDYFFQRDLAHFFTARGARFFALDLPGYGRSIRPGRTPGYTTSLQHYDGAIELALQAMDADADGPRRLVLVGHSTGGLILSLWAARHPGRAAAVVLNSPWLELQLGEVGRDLLAPLVAARAVIAPKGLHPVVDLGFYTRAQREIGTLPDSPAGWRPVHGFPTHPAWLAAVLDGHRRVAAGLDVGAPALTLLSARSSTAMRWTRAAVSTDTVLVVDDIASRAARLSASTTVARIDGAIHDVFLSQEAPRRAAFDALGRWLPYALG